MKKLFSINLGVASSFVRLYDFEKNIKTRIKTWNKNYDVEETFTFYFSLFVIFCSIVIIEYSMWKVTESNPNWILSKRQPTLFSINEMRNNDKVITIFGFTFAEWMQANENNNKKMLGNISVMLVIVEILAIHENLIILSWNWSFSYDLPCSLITTFVWKWTFRF